MKPTTTADSIPHFCQPSHLHPEHSPTIQPDSQLSNLQTDHVTIMSPTLSTDSTEIISIKNNNKKETKSEKQPMIKVFFDKSRIPENPLTRVCDEQTDQRDPLNTEDIPQHLTEISQLSRTHSTKCEKFIKLNSNKLHLFNTEKLFENWHVQIFLPILYLTIFWNSPLRLMIDFSVTESDSESAKPSVI